MDMGPFVGKLPCTKPRIATELVDARLKLMAIPSPEMNWYSDLAVDPVFQPVPLVLLRAPEDALMYEESN